MHNSPLKCTTNADGAKTSPLKHGTTAADSPVKRDFNSSPDKAAHRTGSGSHAAENKPTTYASPSSLARKANSPSKKTFASPSSPGKRQKPFGKPIEIIRSKYHTDSKQ